MRDWVAQRTGESVVPWSATVEVLLREEDGMSLLRESGAHQGLRSALPDMVAHMFRELRLCRFFTAGPQEVKAWTIREGTCAPEAAGRIHSDLQQFFVCAEVVTVEALRQAEGDLQACKAAGKVRTEGREDCVRDGDVVVFKFNEAAAAAEKKRRKS